MDEIMTGYMVMVQDNNLPEQCLSWRNPTQQSVLSKRWSNTLVPSLPSTSMRDPQAKATSSQSGLDHNPNSSQIFYSWNTGLFQWHFGCFHFCHTWSLHGDHCSTTCLYKSTQVAQQSRSPSPSWRKHHGIETESLSFVNNVHSSSFAIPTTHVTVVWVPVLAFHCSVFPAPTIIQQLPRFQFCWRQLLMLQSAQFLLLHPQLYSSLPFKAQWL